MVEALLIVDKKARGLFLVEGRQTRPFAALLLELDAAAHHVGNGQARADLIEKFGRKAHGFLGLLP